MLSASITYDVHGCASTSLFIIFLLVFHSKFFVHYLSNDVFVCQGIASHSTTVRIDMVYRIHVLQCLQKQCSLSGVTPRHHSHVCAYDTEATVVETVCHFGTVI